MGSITKSLKDSSPYDYLPSVLSGIFAVLLTGGFTTIYGIDITQTFGGFSWLSVPVVGLILATLYIWVTNEYLGSPIAGETLNIDKLTTDEVAGTFFSLHLVVLEIFEPQFYTDAIFGNATEGSIVICFVFVVLTVLGNQVLSKYNGTRT